MASKPVGVSSVPASTGVSVAALAEKLSILAGSGKLADREWRIRNRCQWHRKAKSSVRHLLYGERRPSFEEAREIEAAYALHCADKLEANRRENAALVESIVGFAEMARRVDEDFYASHLEALREALSRLGLEVPEPRRKDNAGGKG